MLQTERFQRAIALIDAANAADPRKITLASGEEVPYELAYGRRMSDQLADFAPDASEVLQLAARAQHLERWIIPRNDYPMDRVGYLKWRNALKAHHAKRCSAILADVGYEAELIERVAFLLEKKKLRLDAETQCLEDVICLVFFRFYALDFAAGHPEEKVIDILRKTWRKMSEKGRAAALALQLDPDVDHLLKAALRPA